MERHAILHEVRCTVNQQTPFGTAGVERSCCVLRLADQAYHPQPVYWVEQRVEQTFLIPKMKEFLCACEGQAVAGWFRV